VLKLPQILTQTTASACLRELVGLMPAEPAGVLVHAAELSRFDSAALAVLLALRRQALGLGKTFAIDALPSRLGDLARLYGITDLLPPPVK
jgi:phospholipid transport system transporter-binding protein